MKKTAIITGSSRGIGYAIARELGRDGYNIVVVATGDKSRYQDNLKWFDENKIDYIYVQANIAKSEDRQKIVDSAVESFGGIHVLVNNAGVAPLIRADILEMTEESYDRVLAINTKATMFLTQKVALQMIKQPMDKKRGTIINVASMSSVVSSVSRGEYCISKAGMSMLTTLYADRLAEENILVHEVRPGVIATDMTEGVKGKYDKMIEDGIFPIKRWGVAEDVAGVVSLLCSEKMTYSTGNHIDVDGGFHIRRL